jgi:large subunit ribosomal protein L35
VTGGGAGWPVPKKLLTLDSRLVRGGAPSYVTLSPDKVARPRPGSCAGPEGHAAAAADGDVKMPKLKTKSGAKKRFKITARGKVKVQQAGKRHGMIKRTNKFIRQARGTTVMSEPDARIVKSFMPYS